jgi:Na+:H+ antiporter, NhaA family
MNNNSDSIIASFFKMEAAGGILLMIATVLALLASNTGLHSFYDLLLSTPLEIRIGALGIAKPLLLWINDGLMAVFFFHVGLELKRELLEGELSDKRNIILPGVGAIGGMLVPACTLFMICSSQHRLKYALEHWALPSHCCSG